EGKLYTAIKDHSFKSADCIEFLTALLRRIPGRLLVVWDGAPIHRSRAIQTFLSEGASKRLRLEPLPGYAPDLNPDEGIWRYLKYVELKNLCCQNIEHLKDELNKARERLRHKKHIIQACFRQAGCV